MSLMRKHDVVDVPLVDIVVCECSYGGALSGVVCVPFSKFNGPLCVKRVWSGETCAAAH